jgi:chromate reductase
MNKYNVALIVGSLRQNSLDRRVAQSLISLMPPTLSSAIVEIGDLPFYNEDLEKTTPAAWVRFRNELSSFQAVIFVTPEYNRSVPAVLKNAVDVGSRPGGKSVWTGKPALVISTSTGAMGGFGANHHLRQSLVYLNMPTMQQPEIYIGGAAKLFNEAGKLINESTSDFLAGALIAFSDWTDRVLKPL